MGNSTLPLGGGDTTKLSEVILQPGHTFAPGDVVRPDTANPEEYILAQADTAENAEAVGIVETVAGPSFQITFQGKIDLSSVTWTDLPFLSLSEVWFLSDTVAGELTRTPPSTAGTVIKAMLVVNNITGGSEEGILTGYIGVQIGGENLVDLNDIQPVGSIMPWAAAASSPLPNGWRFCNGDSLDTTDFAELFAVIAYDYGGAASNFNVPDLQGRFPIGQDVGGDVDFDQVGETGGEKEHILSADELPSHTHEVDPGQTDFVTRQQGTPGQTLDTTAGADETDFPTNTGDVDFPGSGNLPHNNMPPFLTINFIIRTTAQSSAALLDHGLSDHFDVDTTGAADCDYLKLDAGTWKPSPYLAGLRNFLANGNFSCWQRAVLLKQTAAFPGPPLAPLAEYTAPTGINDFFIACDRWRFASNVDVTGTATASGERLPFTQGQTEVPGNPRFYITRQGFVTGGGGIAACLIDQIIERSDTLSGKTCTVSFWARGDGTTGPGNETGAVGFAQCFDIPTGGDPSVVVPFQTFTLIANTWVFYKFTFDIPSVFGKTIGTGGNNNLQFKLMTHTNATTAIEVGIAAFSYTGFVDYAQVQLEEGLIATPFERRSFQEEFDLCQRYFSTGSVHHYGSHGVLSEMSHNVAFPVAMRNAPTITIFDTGSVNVAGAPVVSPVIFPGFGSRQFFYQQDILPGPLFSGLARYVWSADTGF